MSSYENIVKSTVLNKGTKVQASVPSKSADGSVKYEQYFRSKHAVDAYNAAEKYSATHIDFRAKSEHTVDGRRYDLEMQVVHTAEKPATVRRLQEVKDDY